jgi:hypothetical protein
MEPCTRPPKGWRCTRGRHLSQEPCAAVPDDQKSYRAGDLLLTLLAMLGSRAARNIIANDGVAREQTMDKWFK